MKRALLSVYDKTHLDRLAHGLYELDYQLISTGGTAEQIRKSGVPVTEVHELTGFPEILDGRVKTLHPAIHAAILADPGKKGHLESLERLAIAPIHLVGVNLYPFSETVSKPHDFNEAIDMIDIGGPAMLRAAAKNHSAVIVLCDPSDYESVLQELRKSGDLSQEFRRKLAAKAFALAARYDALIASYLAEGDEEYFVTTLPRALKLRYGENPDQSAVAYVDPEFPGVSVLSAELLGGKELSYNNLLDADAAIEACLSFETPAAVVVKHLTPCGVALAHSIDRAVRRALDADPVSAFGGVVAVNRPVDVNAARELTATNQFLEVIAAPGFEQEGLRLIESRRGWGSSVRLIAWGQRRLVGAKRVRSVAGGLLVQTDQPLHPFEVRVVTRRSPTAEELAELEFAWRVVRHVKSNAIVLSKQKATIGIGSGQTSRVASVRIAVQQAGENARGSVLASDGFFPFPDGILAAAEAGVTAVVQPGGSKRDEEVIAAADEAGIAMVFTDIRQFRH